MNRELVSRILLKRFYDPGDVLARVQQNQGTLKGNRGFDGIPRLQSESMIRPTPFSVRASALTWTPRKFDRPVYIWCHAVKRIIRIYPGDSMPETGADLISRGMYFSSATGFFRIPTDGAYFINTPITAADIEGKPIEFLYADSLADVGAEAADVIGEVAGAPAFDLRTVNGTIQTAIDLSGKWAPRVLSGLNPNSFAVNDVNTTIRLAARVGRRFLYLKNIGANPCGLAFLSGQASPVKGIILDPNEICPMDALDGVTEEAVYAACATGLSTTIAYQEGT